MYKAAPGTHGYSKHRRLSFPLSKICARTTSTCPRRRTRPSASSSRALYCAPAPGHMPGMGAPPKKQETPGGSRAPACGHAAAPSSHAMRMRCVCALVLIMHCAHLWQLHLLHDRLRCWLGGSDWRSLRDPRMHRLEHPYVLRAKDSPGGSRKVRRGAQEHAAGRGAQPHPVRCASRKKPVPSPPHRLLCCSSSLASSS